MTLEQKVIIDDKEYLYSELPLEAQNQINNLKITEAEIARQESLLAMLKTAQASYARLLGEALAAEKAKPAAAKPATAKSTATKSTATKAAAAKTKAKPGTGTKRSTAAKTAATS